MSIFTTRKNYPRGKQKRPKKTTQRLIKPKIAFTPTTSILPTKSITSTPVSKIADLCAEFPKTQGEISCEEAKKLVLEKYPGKISGVGKQEVRKRKAWLVQVEFNNSSGAARIAIDRETKEVLSISLQK